MKKLVLAGGDITLKTRCHRNPPTHQETANFLVNPQVLDEIRSYVPSEMPEIPGLEGLIGQCSKPFRKQLTYSDVRDDQSRLSINKEDVEECVLPLLDKEIENPASGILVTTYDRYGNAFKMELKVWTGKIHVLTGGWKAFYHRHRLQKLQDFVTLWMFRRLDTGKLCFLMTWRRLPGVQGHIKRKFLRGN